VHPTLIIKTHLYWGIDDDDDDDDIFLENIRWHDCNKH
jgi:hypothetical protein